MRLIDADELLKTVDKEREYLIARGQTGAEHILVHNFRDLIDNAPTVCGNNPKWCESCVSKGKCASTRLQGEWHVRRNKYYSGGGYYYCNKCNQRYSFGAYFELDNENFCPNCGAKMKGDSEE